MKQSSVILTVICAIAAAFLASGCNKSSSPAAIAITIMPSTTVTLDEGESYTFTAQVKNDTSNTGVTWILYNDKTTVPVSCTIPSCGTLSNITNYNVTYTAPTGLLGSVKVSVQATSNSQESITTVATVTTVLPPMITTLSLPSGQNGVAYSQTISVTGGVTPLVYSVSSGSLPAGLHVGAGGIISGTPSGSGTSQFTLKVADSGVPPVAVSQAYTITVAPAPPLTIATTSPLPQGVVGSAYSETIASNGGIPPLTWSLIGALPPGLAFTVNTTTGGSTTPVTTGEISGIPLSAGTFTFSVQVYDSSIPEQLVTAAFSLTIVTPSPLKITTASLPGGTTALGYSAVLQATGGAAPYAWIVAPGLLPPGLTLNSSSGVITGTPIREGTSEFTITVTDSEQPSVTALDELQHRYRREHKCASAISALRWAVRVPVYRLRQVQLDHDVSRGHWRRHDLQRQRRNCRWHGGCELERLLAWTGVHGQLLDWHRWTRFDDADCDRSIGAKADAIVSVRSRRGRQWPIRRR